jgi:hypothetical protein
MKYKISPKDTTSKIVLDNVEYHWLEGNTFCFRFEGGKVRKYPFNHIWFVEIGD